MPVAPASSPSVTSTASHVGKGPTAAPASGKACNACFTGAVLPGDPRGSMLKFAGLNCYRTSPQEGSKQVAKVVVIATDAFGLGINNPRIIADAIAEALKLEVWVPDLLEGDYPSFEQLKGHTSRGPINKKPLLERLGIYTQLIYQSVRYMGVTFFYRHRMEVVLPLAKRFCSELREEKGYSRIGMVGYCLGGQVSTLLAGDELSPGCIDVAVTAHPGFLKVSDFERLKVPFALICAEEDFSFDLIRTGAISALKKTTTVPTTVYNNHPGTVHGFAARSDVEIPHCKEQFEQALSETVEFLRQHL